MKGSERRIGDAEKDQSQFITILSVNNVRQARLGKEGTSKFVF